MAEIQWEDGYSVKVDELDEQHQYFIKLINDLDLAIRKGRGKTILSQIIDELTAYAQSHFATEESYFERISYPGAEQQKKEHHKFIEAVSIFKAAYISGHQGLSIQVPMWQYLRTWLCQHIINEDKKYASASQDGTP